MVRRVIFVRCIVRTSEMGLWLVTGCRCRVVGVLSVWYGHWKIIFKFEENYGNFHQGNAFGNVAIKVGHFVRALIYYPLDLWFNELFACATITWSVSYTYITHWCSQTKQAAVIYEIRISRILTYWGRDKMDAISLTTFLNAFSWTQIFEFRLKFHWSLFHIVQLTIC